MDEYTASRTQVQKIIKAAQSMRDAVTCSICIDYFEKPVTIRCGHKFCYGCILEVANNDNANCPLCNTKIQKRSIPKESNKQWELCVNQFVVLAKAIYDDTGIDVLQPCHKTKDSRESVLPRSKPSTSRVEEASISSKGSLAINSRVRTSNKAALQRKSSTPKTRSARITNNTLHRYLSAKSNCSSDEKVVSQDKVESWLECIEPADTGNEEIDDDKNVIEETDNDADSNLEDSSLNKNKYENEPSTSKSCFTEMKENSDKPLPHTYPSTSKTTKKYKETEMRIQEAEIIAKKKKLNQGLAERAILKTPSSVPATSHSDAQDWRRVKRVGKEMQVNTFKSLNVSKEKSSSSIVLDDTVPCNFTSIDSKDVSRDTDSNINSSINVNIPVNSRGIKPLQTSSKSKKLNCNNEEQDQHYNHSMDSTNSLKEDNTSLSCLDAKQVHEIIGIQLDQEYVKSPEKTRNVHDVSKPEIIPKQKILSPFKTNTNLQPRENDLSSEESSNFDSKSTVINHKLSLKVKLSDSLSSKSTRSHISASDKMSQNKSDSPKKCTPERPKSRLSLRLQSSKPIERKLNPKKSPEKSHNSLSNVESKSVRSPTAKIVEFIKLGKIGKRQKYIPFKRLGRLCPKVAADKVNVKIKSYENIVFDLSRIKSKRSHITDNKVQMLQSENDSCLQYLALEASPCAAQQVNKKIMDHKISEFLVNQTRQTIEPMEIDESLPETNIIPHGNEIKSNSIVMDRGDKNDKTDSLELIPPTSNLEESKESTRTNFEPISEPNFDCAPLETCKKVIENVDKINIDNCNTFKKTTNISKCRTSKDTEKSKMDKNNKIRSNLQKCVKTVEEQDDAISICSNDSESKYLKSYGTVKKIDDDLDRKSKHSEAESVTSESSLIYVPKHIKELDEKKSVCSSRSSSPLRTLSLKRKRRHSESSNDDDDDDVSSIIGKWTNDKSVIKKPKVCENKNKLNASEIFNSDDNEKTLVEDEFKEPQVSKPQRDPPIDDIISKVKSFREEKENYCNTNKLTGLPSSLQSADLFESNDLITRDKVETIKQLNEITSDNSSVNSCNYKESDKENRNQSFEAEEVESEKTVIDSLQFDRKKSNDSVCSNSSNKENNACKVNISSCNIENLNEAESSPNQKRIAEKSHDSPIVDSYHVPDTLMNITQEQLAFKMIEKDLMGDFSTVIKNDNKDDHENNVFATPRRKATNLRVPKNDDEYDSENIDATPVAKKRRRFNIGQNKSNIETRTNSSDNSSPEKNLQLIPAVTPMRNTKSYPLCHSTPMIQTPSPEKESGPPKKRMALICSGLTPENVKLVQQFAKKFNATFLSTFSDDVTHVIVATDPETKAGQKTFKYIQGIAFKKFVLDFQWIIDCLDENTLLDEDNEKYDVLDPEILECGSRRSRRRVQDLFERFAFFCLEPFNSIPLKDFKNLLVNNGAVVTSTVKELSLRNDKFRVILLESEELDPKLLATLKRIECIIVTFEWVVDSISQYQIVSLFAYLYETTPEEAIAVGFPESYLKEEEEEDEEEV